MVIAPTWPGDAFSWKRHHRFATDGTWDKVQRAISRPRTRPDRVQADKAYSSRAIRAHLRTRGIGSVIPEPDDQKAHRKRIGSSGSRPVTYDRTAYRGRTVIERAFNGFKHWRGQATRYDKHAIIYRGGLVLAAVLLWPARSR